MTFIDSWDSNAPNAFWDTGLDWDTNQGAPTGDVTPYLNLLASQHRTQPNLISFLTTILQAAVDDQVLLAALNGLFDIDTAVGAQLDVIGQWVGVTRDVKVPLTGVYFTWDSTTLGWSAGVWQFPENPATGLVILDDATYRVLIRAKIAANHWDGTIPGAYTVWNTIFAGTGVGILIQDYGDMSVTLALTGPPPTPIIAALFASGALDLKPAGVAIRAHMTPPLPGTPYFGWGVENSVISGWSGGAWGVPGAGD